MDRKNFRFIQLFGQKGWQIYLTRKRGNVGIRFFCHRLYAPALIKISEKKAILYRGREQEKIYLLICEEKRQIWLLQTTKPNAPNNSKFYYFCIDHQTCHFSPQCCSQVEHIIMFVIKSNILDFVCYFLQKKKIFE
jgi:hypothetical protein